MNNKQNIFIKDLNDLDNCINSNNDHEILKAALILRKYFLDNEKNNDKEIKKVNTWDLEIMFEITDTFDNILNISSIIPSLMFSSSIAELDPFLAPKHFPRVTKNHQDFFDTNIGIANGKNYSVSDLVKQAADVMGTVHFGNLKTTTRKNLKELDDIKYLTNIHTIAEQLLVVSRITIRALQELQYKILELEKFENQKGVSANFAIVVLPKNDDENNFIVDLGVEKNKNRISFYVDNNHNLNLTFFDQNQTRYKITKKFSNFYSKPIYLSFEIGCFENQILLSIEDGNHNHCQIVRGNEDFSFCNKNNLNIVLGSDFEGKKLTSINLVEIAIFERILPPIEKYKIYKYFLESLKKFEQGSIEFRDNQFLYSDNHPNFKEYF